MFTPRALGLLVLKLLIDDVEVSTRPAASALQVVLFELVRQFQVGHRLFGRLSRLERLASVFEKELIELAVIDEVLPRQRAARRVAGDDRVDILDCGCRFGDRVRIGDAASAVVSVNQRLAFVCERAIRSQAQVVVPYSASGPEPLCACWHTAAAGKLRSGFERGVRKVTEGIALLRAEVLDDADWKRFDSEGRLFWNMNTAADYEEARRVLEAGRK